MKKKVISLVALVLVAMFAFSACGGGVTPPPATNPPAQAETPAGPEAPPAAPPAAPEQVYELTLHHHDPPTSATGIFLEAYAEKVSEASNGALEITVFHGGALGGARDTVDMITNGTCDIGWGLPSFFPGRFPATEVMMLPMLGILSAEQGSRAIWDLYQNTDFLKDEYKEFKVLLLHTNCDSPIATKSKVINTVADLQGVSLRANAGPPTEFVKLLKGTPASIVIGELYSSFEKGVVDGAITDWHAIWAFKFYEQLNNYLDEHCAVSPYFLLMNQAKYDSLPADLQKVLDDCSGEAALDLAGSAWDDVQAEVMQIIKDRGGNIYKLPADEQVKLAEIAKETWSTWVADVTSKGHDGQAILDKSIELVEKYKK